MLHILTMTVTFAINPPQRKSWIATIFLRVMSTCDEVSKNSWEENNLFFVVN